MANILSSDKMLNCSPLECCSRILRAPAAPEVLVKEIDNIKIEDQDIGIVAFRDWIVGSLIFWEMSSQQIVRSRLFLDLETARMR